jgi:hypothetical protein
MFSRPPPRALRRPAGFEWATRDNGASGGTTGGGTETAGSGGRRRHHYRDVLRNSPHRSFWRHHCATHKHCGYYPAVRRVRHDDLHGRCRNHQCTQPLLQW